MKTNTYWMLWLTVIILCIVAGSAAAAYGIMGVHIGDDHRKVVSLFGEPLHRYPSAYGYENWVYFSDDTGFMQLGVSNGKIKDIYSNSVDWSFQGISVGTPISEVIRRLSVERDLEFVVNDVTYSREQDLERDEFLIVLLDHAIIAQVHLDIHDDYKVTSLRLTHHDVYVYRRISGMSWTFFTNNPPPDPPELSESERLQMHEGEAWAMFHCVNGFRQRFGLSVLYWVPDLAEVALGHSVDMYEAGFFAHDSPNTGSVRDRIQNAELPFATFAENIACQQMDAVAATDSLMNSLGHRRNILNDGFTGLGTGVYELFYTQKFIRMSEDDEANYYRTHPPTTAGSIRPEPEPEPEPQPEPSPEPREEPEPAGYAQDLIPFSEMSQEQYDDLLAYAAWTIDDRPTILRWPGQAMPLAIGISRGYSSELQALLENVVAQLNRVSPNLRLEVVGPEESHDITLLRVPAHTFNEYRDFGSNTDDWDWAWNIFWDGTPYITQGEMYLGDHVDSIKHQFDYMMLCLKRLLGISQGGSFSLEREDVETLRLLYEYSF